MDMVSKKTLRSNKSQINYLCTYMHSNKEFAAGEYQTPQGAAQFNREWAKLKAALDELGPRRSIEQWKVCWRDQKRKARTEGGALARAMNATGNSVVVPELSPNSTLILGTIGTEMAVGCGPEESPIGFNPHTPLLPPNSSKPTCIQPRPVKRVRERRNNPPNQFLKAQLEMNDLIKELIKEVRQSNKLKEELNQLIKQGATGLTPDNYMRQTDNSGGDLM